MTKRGPKKAEPISTNELCSYGCGCVAKFKNKTGNLMCESAANKCVINKDKNRNGVTKAHADGKIPTDFGGNRGWAKGLTQVDLPSLARPQWIGRRFGVSLTGHTEQSKSKLRAARLKVILDGKYDSSGRKGHRGHYDTQYFHSSWELAYYIWQKEVYSVCLTRNFTEKISYTSNGSTYTYVPDFVTCDNTLIEVKGYLFSQRDHDKYNQSKDKVIYVFEEQMREALSYSRNKYGKNFWETLYING